MRSKRAGFAVVLAVVTILGLATRIYGGPASGWVADSLGGFFYVLFFIFLVLVVRPRASAGAVALWVFGVTCALEVTQLWHPAFLEAFRATFLGHGLIGETFAWPDFLYYALAAAAAPPLARFARGMVQSPVGGTDDERTRHE